MPTSGIAYRAALASQAVIVELLNHMQSSGALTFDEASSILNSAKTRLIRKGTEETLGAALIVDSIRELVVAPQLVTVNS